MINGICLVSFHSIKQLQLDDMKEIMGDIMNLIEEEYNQHGEKDHKAELE
jgi:hypothetical protein